MGCESVSERTGVKPASKTSIAIAFTYQGIECRERIKLPPTPANLRRAAQFRAAVIDSIERGTFDYRVTFPHSKNALKFAEKIGEVKSVESYLESWLEQKKAHVKAATFTGYRKAIMHHWIPAIGKNYLSDLKRTQIVEYCDGLETSNKTVRNRLSVLRSALADAVHDDLIDISPMHGWSWRGKQKPKKAEDDIDPFTAKEQSAILARLTGQEKNLFQFAFWTGMRTSELCALEWGDIDVKRGIVRVSKALTRSAIAQKIEEEDTKTRAGRRDVKLLGPALEALQDQRQYTYLARRHVFHNPRTGERWGGDKVIRTAWIRALSAAEVRYRNPYQTRHTFASMMLTAGEAPMWVAQQMGHKDWTMIARVYGKWIKDAMPDAGSKAVALFSPMEAAK